MVVTFLIQCMMVSYSRLVWHQVRLLMTGCHAYMIGASHIRGLPTRGSEASYKLKDGTATNYDHIKFNVKVSMLQTWV